MKYLPIGISVLAMVIVLSYIRFDQSNHTQQAVSQKNPQVAFYSYDNPPGGEYAGYLNAVSFELPDELYFAGERVPLEVPDVRERLDRELHINTYWHSSTIFLIKQANRWLPQMEKILKENGVPEDFKYLTAIEGGFINQISPANAVGFWQIREGAGKEFGLEITREVDERYDPLKSTEAACKYLKKAYNRFGSWTNAAASYNRGMYGLAKALDNQEVDSYYDLLLNSETSRYVFRILAIKEIIEHPSKYGFNIDEEHLYKQEPLRYVKVEDDINDLVEFAKEQGINYKLLNRHNPWLRKKSLNVRNKKSYQIAIPVNP
ncbi:MAG: lytic transglycosylase domain-containing protein [Fulvivirga sp.]|nr:lytic transglycosylase domain-containing protein [Fulvivirga sp.]